MRLFLGRRRRASPGARGVPEQNAAAKGACRRLDFDFDGTQTHADTVPASKRGTAPAPSRAGDVRVYVRRAFAPSEFRSENTCIRSSPASEKTQEQEGKKKHALTYSPTTRPRST